ncbi:hypothetical protein M501DRAFT_340621 [Patellaria atrata CBS 101060]|uniref:Cytochrome b561 domain-containing protein n=1 Tax=Patellaria atrata CBS 101060 TaxID=1346257 RepID=A0A9P4S4M2_9PEZI|nr:hypothetical protein M501DRAFT_340621 [Patellaria atrata CBS 101060]
MASATGIPDQNPSTIGRGEDEPLLGRAGDASQQEGKPLYYNPFLGTAVLAQAGIWILLGIVWGGIFSHDLILFSAHPLLNSTGILFSTQAILLLQPTHTSSQKRSGTYAHLISNDLAILLLIAGLIVIEYNKFSHGGAHFESPHAVFGLMTYILLALQATVGVTMYFVPSLYGGIDNAKKAWKYHRMSGYLTLLFMLMTVAAATQTTYNIAVLHINLWAVLVAAVLTWMGVLARVKKQKLGL